RRVALRCEVLLAGLQAQDAGPAAEGPYNLDVHQLHTCPAPPGGTAVVTEAFLAGLGPLPPAPAAPDPFLDVGPLLRAVGALREPLFVLNVPARDWPDARAALPAGAAFVVVLVAGPAGRPVEALLLSQARPRGWAAYGREVSRLEAAGLLG